MYRAWVEYRKEALPPKCVFQGYLCFHFLTKILLFCWNFLRDLFCALQDNEPLMRALSKLIYLNNPDLVLFVGEALVGNDAVDQLSKFNQVELHTFSWIPLLFIELFVLRCFVVGFSSSVSACSHKLIMPVIAEISWPFNYVKPSTDRRNIADQVWHYWW